MVAQDLTIRNAVPTGRRRWRFVAEAPKEADEALVAIARLPRWLGLVAGVGGSGALWAAIFVGLR